MAEQMQCVLWVTTEIKSQAIKCKPSHSLMLIKILFSHTSRRDLYIFSSDKRNVSRDISYFMRKCTSCHVVLKITYKGFFQFFKKAKILLQNAPPKIFPYLSRLVLVNLPLSYTRIWLTFDISFLFFFFFWDMFRNNSALLSLVIKTIYFT